MNNPLEVIMNLNRTPEEWKGYCWDVHVILKMFFPDAIPYYNGDHVITKIGDHYYDINGLVLWNYIPMTEDEQEKAKEWNL